mmetsp:Transcript_2073/g.2759  ORF Transcript_2073/g.2759 Transcript_2073/m.2759 type:complete len:111 (+) Transcript_2073:635-967(+)
MDNNISCWSLLANDSSWIRDKCTDDKMQCEIGSIGSLCGSCDIGYVYQSLTNKCGKCGEAQSVSYIFIGILVLGAILFMIYLKKGDYFELKNNFIVKFAYHLDGGSLKVI